MRNRFLLVISLSVLFFISCSSATDITWQGNWMSEKNYDERGTFTFNLQIEYEELSGTITIPDMGISDLQIEGEMRRDTLFGLLEITDIEFSDINDRMTFTATAETHEIASDTRVAGVYTDAASGDYGRWYSKDNNRKDFSDISSFPLDSSIVSPDGLCFDGNNLWLSDHNSPATIYKIDATNGTIIDLFDVSGIVSYPEGLAWDGSNIWCIGNWRLFKFDTLGSLLSEIPDVIANGGDIAYAYGYIWRGDPSFGSLQTVNPSDGSVEGTYDSPVLLPSGLAFDGTDLWISAGYDIIHWPAIYKIDLSGNILDIYDSPCYSSAGFAFGDSCLYCVDFGNNRIFKLGF